MKFVATSPLDAFGIQKRLGAGWTVAPHKKKPGVFIATQGRGFGQTTATIRIMAPPAKSSLSVMKQSLSLVSVAMVVGGISVARAIATNQGLAFGILDAAIIGGLGGGLGALVTSPFVMPVAKRLASQLNAA